MKMKFTLIHANNLPPVNLPILPENDFYLLWKAEGMKTEDAEKFKALQEAMANALQDGKISVKEAVSIVSASFTLTAEQKSKIDAFGSQLEAALSDNKINFFEAISLAFLLSRIIIPTI